MEKREEDSYPSHQKDCPSRDSGTDSPLTDPVRGQSTSDGSNEPFQQGKEPSRREHSLEGVFHCVYCEGNRSKLYLPSGRLRKCSRAQAFKGCQSWACRACGRRKQWAFVVGVESHLRNGRKWVLATFTLPAHARLLALDERRKLLRDMWPLFRKRLVNGGKPVACIWVFEKHGDGTPHIHALFDRFLPRQTLQAIWMAVGGGPQVDVRQRDPHWSASYIAKELREPPANGDRQRRFGASKGIRIDLGALLAVLPQIDPGSAQVD